MTRILSALVMIAIVVGGIWLLPVWGLVVLAEVVVLLAFLEYASLAASIGLPLPTSTAAAAAMTMCAACAWPGVPLDLPLVATLVACAAVVLGSSRPAPQVLGQVSAAVFAAIYLGLPLGLLVAVRGLAGREAVLLLLLTVVASDTCQYYSGRLFGRHLLAPTISPKKTAEGAVGGFVGGIVALVVAARWWLPAVGPWRAAMLAAMLVALGITGDLFESLLKRSAGVKDSSMLIPGHGGVLDRIDALLFATPGFYVFVRYGM